MSFTNQTLGVLGTAAGAAYLGKKLQNEKLQTDAANAEDLQTLNRMNDAMRNDSIEAAEAIKAHAADEGLTPEQVASLDEKDPDKLAANVDAIRRGIMTENRKTDLKESGERYKKYKGNKIDNIYKTKDNLERAYNRFRELNQRIDASSQLKYERDAAMARLKARGVKV